MRWLALPLGLLVLAALAYALWPRPSMSVTGGLDAAAVAAALANLDADLDADLDAGRMPAVAATRAATSEPMAFPQDHGAHPEAGAELWELNALLQDEDGQRVAVRLSLARLDLIQGLQQRSSALAAHSLFAADLAVAAGGELKSVALREQRLSRAALELAGAGTDEAGVERVWVEQWALSRPTEGVLRLRAEANGVDLELELSSLKPPVVLDLQTSAGSAPQSQSAPSRFYSQTRLAVSGSLRTDGIEHQLQGLGWFDHGWGALSEALSGGRGQLVANRFQLQLDDGSELACFHLRRRRGGGTAIPSCVLIDAAGEQRGLQRRDLTLAPTDAGWVTEGGVSYPFEWRLLIPSQGIELEIRPLFDDLASGVTTLAWTQGGQLWRGAVELRGRRGTERIGGQGRMDLNGYAEGKLVGT
ncbi:MAG: lipocalin-like domain-containing protein [Lamprobacter sp.]|uniref:lipocalin-like domain-containing protein n=1 Tax=Lamprobacter sp. TaxID=3100796 RepID=UPI002B263B9E|nr:lipocalin-like domain-containing protein [Lamprobacter sp.]MEA3641934.1 lipocalin-like domain-containing protein [Lamprobacter sp.]